MRDQVLPNDPVPLQFKYEAAATGYHALSSGPV
jgi:hypothetical protein